MQDTSFAQLVSLACHDLRTPLATVSGFAKTLVRMDDVPDQVTRYLEMIEAASDQLGDLVDDLGLVARIEGGRWEPLIREADSLALARAAAGGLGDSVTVTGAGAQVAVEPDVTERSLYSLARCALRHGGLDALEVRAEGPNLVLDPVTAEAGPICLGRELRDFGAAVAVRAVEAQGGAAELDGETLEVRLPLAPVVS